MTASPTSTMCNGIAFSKCPDGENFICPSTGNGYCQTPEVPQTVAAPQTAITVAAPQTTVDASNNSAECAQEAATLFAAKKASRDSALEGTDISDAEYTYVNHYNASQGKCFLLITDGDTSSSYYQGLWDAYANTEIAVYNSAFTISPNTARATYFPATCEINNVSGCTETQFDALLNSDMEGTSLTSY